MSVRPSSVVNELPVKAPPPSRLRQVLAAGVAEKQAQESKPILTTGVPTSTAASDTYEEVWKVLEALKEKAGGAVSNDKELDNLRKSVKGALESLKDPDTVDRLQKDILNKGVKVSRLEGDLYKKNILIQDVMQQLQTANALQEKVERDIGELQKELTEKKLRVTNLSKDLLSVANTMKTLRNNLQQERITIQQKQETLDTLSAKERELTKELKGAKDELATTQEGLSNSQGDLEAAQAELSGSKTRAAKLSFEVLFLRAKEQWKTAEPSDRRATEKLFEDFDDALEDNKLTNGEAVGLKKEVGSVITILDTADPSPSASNETRISRFQSALALGDTVLSISQVIQAFLVNNWMVILMAVLENLLTGGSQETQQGVPGEDSTPFAFPTPSWRGEL